jgi:hypothetical protein
VKGLNQSDLRGDGETSRLGSRGPMDNGIMCGPHGAWKSKVTRMSRFIRRVSYQGLLV